MSQIIYRLALSTESSDSARLLKSDTPPSAVATRIRPNVHRTSPATAAVRKLAIDLIALLA
jgi:hypothetical protein